MDPISSSFLATVIYDSVKLGTKFIEPGFRGVLVETYDEISAKYELDSKILEEFFFDTEISELIKKFKKNANFDDAIILQNTFDKLAIENNLQTEEIKIFDEFFQSLENKMSKKEVLWKKIQLHYIHLADKKTSKINDGVKEANQGIAKLLSLKKRLQIMN